MTPNRLAKVSFCESIKKTLTATYAKERPHSTRRKSNEVRGLFFPGESRIISASGRPGQLARPVVRLS
jgi:hypothetical protein